MFDLTSARERARIFLDGVPGEDEDRALRAWIGAGIIAVLCAAMGWWWWQGASFGSWAGMFTYGAAGTPVTPGHETIFDLLIPLSGIQPGRAAGMALVILVPFALWGCWRALPDRRRGWMRPEWWLLATLLWQGLTIFTYGQAIEPSLVWWLERAAAFALACGLMWRWSDDPSRAVAACAASGAGLLLVDLLGRLPLHAGPMGQVVGFGAGAPFGLPNFNSGAGVPLLGVAIGWLLAGARFGITPGSIANASLAVSVPLLLVFAVPLLSMGSAQGYTTILAASDGSAWRGVILIVAGLGLGGLLLVLRCGGVMGPALALGVPAALLMALGIWAPTAHLATWTGLVGAIAAGAILACPRHRWQSVALILVAALTLLSVLAMGAWVSAGGKAWTVLGAFAKPGVLAAVAGGLVAIGGLLLWRLVPGWRVQEPGRLAGMLLATILILGGLGLAIVVSVWGQDIQRWLEPRLQPKPSILQRIFCTAQSFEAVTASPLRLAIGYGAGSTVEVLQQQPSYAGAWLAVPSYLEHAHNETWQVFVEGGLVMAVLLGIGLVLTIAPLWRRREQTMARALLCGWSATLVQAQFESHLSQPGPLIAVALLAAASWAYARCAPVAGDPPAPGADPYPPPAAQLRVGAIVLGGIGVLFAIGELVNVLRELRVGGSPSAIVARTQSRLKSSEVYTFTENGRPELNPFKYAELLEEMRRRIGPLDVLPSQEALLRYEDGDHDRARSLILGQLARFPIDQTSFTVGRMLVDRDRRRGATTEAAELQRAMVATAARTLYWIDHVPLRDNTAGERANLRTVAQTVLALGDRVPSAVQRLLMSDAGAALVPSGTGSAEARLGAELQRLVELDDATLGREVDAINRSLEPGSRERPSQRDMAVILVSLLRSRGPAERRSLAGNAVLSQHRELIEALIEVFGDRPARTPAPAATSATSAR